MADWSSESSKAPDLATAGTLDTTYQRSKTPGGKTNASSPSLSKHSNQNASPPPGLWADVPTSSSFLDRGGAPRFEEQEELGELDIEQEESVISPKQVREAGSLPFISPFIAVSDHVPKGQLGTSW